MNVCADKNRCAWPRSHRVDRFERFRTSKQTGRNPPQAADRIFWLNDRFQDVNQAV